jgi:hypothetical protein
MRKRTSKEYTNEKFKGGPRAALPCSVAVEHFGEMSPTEMRSVSDTHQSSEM